MKSYKFILIIAFFSFISAILGNSESAEKAEILCECLKKAKKTDNPKDKKACLALREKQVTELGKNSPAYTSFVNLLGNCEREIMGILPVTGSYEEKVKSVCECFKQADKNNPSKCFRLQSDTSKSFSDKEISKKFNLETNSCMN